MSKIQLDYLTRSYLFFFFCLLLSLGGGVCLCVQVSVYVGVHLCVDKCICGGQKTAIGIVFLRSHSPRSAFGLHTCAHTHVLNLHHAYTYHTCSYLSNLTGKWRGKNWSHGTMPYPRHCANRTHYLTHTSRLHCQVLARMGSNRNSR